MFLHYSLLVFFFNCLVMNFVCSVVSQVAETEEINSPRKVRQFSDVSQDWMKKVLNVNQDLLNVQAIIAKDEESTTNCMTGSRKTNKRHLMCVGSIVNVQHVLTSATCIQEATYIRHNLRAPLVVVVGILKSEPQVIRVNNYKVHPEHVALPYDSQHSKHNIAVIKLSCRIADGHFTPIEFPTAPYTELCTNDNCLVAVVRKVGKTSHAIYDTWAKHIPASRRTRRSSEKTTELQSNNTSEAPSANIQEKLRKMLATPYSLSLNSKEAQDILLNNITQTAIELAKIEKSLALKNVKEKRYFGQRKEFLDIAHEEKNSEDMPFETMRNLISDQLTNPASKWNKLIIEKMYEPQFSNVSSTSTNIVDEYGFQGDSDGNDKVRLFSIRASDGFQGCPQSGSPVMFGKVQAALVSISCDDRQPATAWNYTDLFANLDWIKKETDTWKRDSNTQLNDTYPGCSTCIYNFFIDLTGPNDKVNCSDLDNLDEESFKFKLCASHSRRAAKDVLSSGKSSHQSDKRFSKFTDNTIKALKSNFPHDSKQTTDLLNYPFDSERRRHNDRFTFQNTSQDSGKDLTKGSGRNFRKVIEKVKSRNFGRILKTNFGQGSNKDFDKKQVGSQKYYLKSPNKNVDTDYDWAVRNQLQKDYLKSVGMKSESRLKKQVEMGEIAKNEFDLPMLHTMKSQQSIDYNPLANKFHNLRLLLARFQKTPGKESQEPLIGKPVKILPHERFLNSRHGIKYVKKENVPLDKRYMTIISG